LTLIERNLKITLAYDGSAFFGFQLQPGVSTVQGVMESAAELVLGENVRVVGSGRTDTGVHALGQVALLKTRCPIPVEKCKFAMNGVLPYAVRIRAIEEVGDDFHPRFSAKAKHYRYLIRLVKERSPFLERFFCQIEEFLDIENMREAADRFRGEHDFSAFAKSPDIIENPVRTILESKIDRENDLLVFDVIGTGFMRNMVRNLAKALILIGQGKMRSQEIVELYRNRDRRRLGAPAPAGGLYLMRVMY